MENSNVFLNFPSGSAKFYFDDKMEMFYQIIRRIFRLSKDSSLFIFK